MCFSVQYSKGSTLGVLQQQCINGHGFVNGDFCIHMHAQNKGCSSLCSYSQQISSQKVGMTHEKMNFAMASVVALPFHVFLNSMSHVAQSRSDLDKQV